MWVKTDNVLRFSASELKALEEIPKGNWLLKFDPQKGFYLEDSPDFKLPPKIYGDAEALAERYLNTFSRENGNLGILLTGLKGTGKSVTAKITATRSELPVIIITEPFEGDEFKSFLSNIKQPVVVFIDEFEKVFYDTILQNNFLTILDGVFEGRKLFIFTSNEKGKINRYMLNRPGRVHYLKEYDSLSKDVIDDVIDDNLENKEHKEGLMEVLDILSDVTMDMLISLIGEMNLYKEEARDAIKFLNLKPDSVKFTCKLFKDNTLVADQIIHYHPLTQENLDIEFWVQDMSPYDNDVPEKPSGNSQDIVRKASAGDDKEFMSEIDEMIDNASGRNRNKTRSDYVFININLDDVEVVNKNGVITMKLDNGQRLEFTKYVPYTYNW